MSATMTPQAFRATLADDAPPRSLDSPLAALWWAKKGEWDKAHRIVTNEVAADAAWVHAYLHRVEGDLDNARYWYAQAGKPPATGSLDDEHTTIVEGLRARR